MAAVLVVCLVSTSYAQLRSDFDGDGSVGFADFLSFAAAFGTVSPAHDLDGNGLVDFGDFLIFVSDFSSAARVPHWTRLEPGLAPSPRLDHSLTLDPVRRQALLFGGKREAVLRDTWMLDIDAVRWRVIPAQTAPDGRRGHTAIYDGARDRVVIFGGETDSGFLDDVWAFDLASETWTEIDASGSKPTKRYGLGAVLDASRNRMLISHGFSASGRFDDTWAFDLVANQWTELPTGNAFPQARCLHDWLLDAEGTTAYLFGGCSSGVGPCPRGDLWAFDLSTQTWSEVSDGTKPSDRSNVRMTQSPTDGRVVLIGGVDTSARSDVWTFDPQTSAWTSHAATGETPPPRWSHAMVTDERTGRVLVYGGTNGAEWWGDLWELRF